MSPFPGRHREEKVTSSQNHLDPRLGRLLDHHPGHPGFATPLTFSLYLSGLAFVINCGFHCCYCLMVAIIILTPGTALFAHKSGDQQKSPKAILKVRPLFYSLSAVTRIAEAFYFLAVISRKINSYAEHQTEVL